MSFDPDFGLNDFNESKTFSEGETIVNNILTLLFMRPGSYPSLPLIGIDIRSYLYKPFDDIDPDEIKAKLASQCQSFIPQIEAGEFDVQKVIHKNKPYLLFVLPVYEKDATKTVTLGLTTSATGEVISKYKIENSL